MATSKIKSDSIDTVAASKLTGSLPAISGASLTGIPNEITKQGSDPTISTNPAGGVGTMILNTSSGEMFVCTDATAGSNVWTNIGDGTGQVAPYMTATGGTVTTDGSYKVHKFTSSGTFQVTQLGTIGTVEYIVVAGGGGGSAHTNDAGGGGGAGGAGTAGTAPAGGNGGIGLQLPTSFRDPKSNVGGAGPNGEGWWVGGGGGGGSRSPDYTTGEGGGPGGPYAGAGEGGTFPAKGQTAAIQGSGGGGGGCAGPSAPTGPAEVGGQGGSGIVLIAYDV